jgi:hypothetical protein
MNTLRLCIFSNTDTIVLVQRALLYLVALLQGLTDGVVFTVHRLSLRLRHEWAFVLDLVLEDDLVFLFLNFIDRDVLAGIAS